MSQSRDRACSMPISNVSTDLGRIRFARVRVGDVKFAARLPAGVSPQGSAIGLKFNPAYVHVYADSRLVEGA